MNGPHTTASLVAGGEAALPASDRLKPWQRAGLVVLALFVLGLGAAVEFRSAFLTHRMGDLDCFLRAGWAVRTGGDLYAVTDNNGFHYNYPPLLAILVAPLADPPAGADRSGMLPFAASVGIWYVFNLVCLALAVHWLAGALAGAASTPGIAQRFRGTQGWWSLRLWPVVACLVPISHTLMRGQSNLLVLALLCASLADVLRERRFRSGIWLAGAICLKIFPAFLVLFPLWRRDGRCLAGCALGLLLGLAVVPAAAMGPVRAWDSYRELAKVCVLPGLGAGGDESRARELTNVTATESQSILNALHNSIYPDFATRPDKASLGLRLTSYAVGGLMTLLTLLAAGRRATRDGPAVVLTFGLLILDMILVCPVCHLHYFSLAVPLVMALGAVRWERHAPPWIGWGLAALFLFGTVMTALPHFPSLHLLRELGVAIYGAAALWLAGLLTLRARRPRAAECAPARDLRAAA